MNLQILALEPFFGGSHKNFISGLIEHSRHTFTLQTLPARFWKWRMRGAALYFWKKVSDVASYDLLFCSDLMSVSDLKALLGKECPPIIVYFHENQLSYPLPPGEKMDYQFGFTDITNCLCADRIVFNSHFHFSRFFEQLPQFIHMMPEYKCSWIPGVIRKKATVLYPGCRFPGIDGTKRIKNKQSDPPLIIWNHRWEFDKNPELFFSVLHRIDRKGLAFSLAVLGENFQAAPTPFLQAQETLKEKIATFGYVPDRDVYIEWLKKGDIVVSTAIQENFGIAVMEAIRFGCRPLLPKRLSYPELIPRRFHDACLYEDTVDLETKLTSLLTTQHTLELTELTETAARFSWAERIGDYDELFERIGSKQDRSLGSRNTDPESDVS